MMTTLEVGGLRSLMPNYLEITVTTFRPLEPVDIFITTFRILVPMEIAITSFRTLAPTETATRLCTEGDCCAFVSILRPSDDQENGFITNSIY